MKAILSGLVFPLTAPDLLVEPQPREPLIDRYTREVEATKVHLEHRQAETFCRETWGGVTEVPSAAAALLRIARLFVTHKDGKITFCDGADFAAADDTLAPRLGSAEAGDVSVTIFRLRRLVPEDMLRAAFMVNGGMQEAPKTRSQQRIILPRLSPAIRSVARDEGLGDYHVHWGAAYRFDHFTPMVRPSEAWGRSNSEFWAQPYRLPGTTFALDLRSIYHAQAVAAWLVAATLAGAELQSKGIRVPNYLSFLTSPDAAKELFEALCKLLFAREAPGLVMFADAFKDFLNCRLQFTALRRGKSETERRFNEMVNNRADPATLLVACLAKMSPSGSGPFAEVLRRWSDLWIRARTLLFVSLTHQEGFPGLPNFKNWFERLKFLELELGPIGVQERVDAVSAGGQVQELEFRFCIDHGNDSNRIDERVQTQIANRLDDYAVLRGWASPGREPAPALPRLCFSAALVKDYMRVEDLTDKRIPHKFLADRYRAQVEALARALTKEQTYRFLVRGLDCCNLERSVPNWLIGAAYEKFRRLTQSSNFNDPGLRYTVHAGEDFAWPVQGLRFIDECISFLRDRDRIGHATALALDFNSWASTRGRDTTVGEWLDDLVWAWTILGETRAFECGINGDTRERLRAVCRHQIRLAQDHLRRFDNLPCLNECVRLHMKSTTEQLSSAYKLRYDFEQLATEHYHYVLGDRWLNQEKVRRLAKDQVENIKIYAEHLRFGAFFSHQSHSVPSYQPGLWEEVAEKARLPLRLFDEAQELYDILSRIVRLKTASKNLVVEVCPSSNLLISDFSSDFAKHPVFSMHPLSTTATDDAPQIRVCVSSDDPITFAADVLQEYMFLYDAAYRRSSGLPYARDKQVQGWLTEIVATGREFRFHPSDPEFAETALYGVWKNQKVPAFRSALSQPPSPL